MRYRYTLLSACRRGSNSRATSLTDRTAMSSGRKWFRPLTNSAGVSLDTVSKLATWPSAWTPASVRPANATRAVSDVSL